MTDCGLHNRPNGGLGAVYLSIYLDDTIDLWSEFHENTKNHLGVDGDQIYIVNTKQ